MFHTCLNKICNRSCQVGFKTFSKNTLLRSFKQSTFNSSTKSKYSTLLNFGVGALGFGCLAAGAFALNDPSTETDTWRQTKANYCIGSTLSKEKKSRIVVIGGNSNLPLVGDICKHLEVENNPAHVGTFNDGEIDIKLEGNVRGKHVYIIQSTSPPASNNLMELLLLISTARRASAEKITAIIPYYGYGRINSNDKNKEALLAGADVSEMLMSMGVDDIVSVDLYREQIQGFFTSSIPLDNLQVSHLFAAYLVENFDLHEPVIISPTAHGVTRAKFFRNALTKLKVADSTMALAIHIKQEKYNNKVDTAVNTNETAASAEHMDEDDEVNDSINLPINEKSTENNKETSSTTSTTSTEENIPYEIIGDVKGKDVIIVDNMIITGSTLVGVSKKLMQEGANRVIAIATHGLYVDNAIEDLSHTSIERIITSNTVITNPKEHNNPKFERLNIAALIAEVICRHENNQQTLDLNNLDKWYQNQQNQKQ